jgi:hypothetical protein
MRQNVRLSCRARHPRLQRRDCRLRAPESVVKAGRDQLQSLAFFSVPEQEAPDIKPLIEGNDLLFLDKTIADTLKDIRGR